MLLKIAVFLRFSIRQVILSFSRRFILKSLKINHRCLVDYPLCLYVITCCACVIIIRPAFLRMVIRGGMLLWLLRACSIACRGRATAGLGLCAAIFHSCHQNRKQCWRRCRRPCDCRVSRMLRMLTSCFR